MNTVTSAQFAGREGPAAAQDSTQGQEQAWSAFASAASDEAFCRAWLSLQCTAIPAVRAGLLLLRPPGGEAYVPAAVWPDVRRDMTYLTEAAERALTGRRGAILGLDAADKVAPGSVHVAYPIETDGELHGTVVLDVGTRPEAQLQAVLRQMLWGSGWLEALLRRQGAGREARMLERAATGLDLLQAAQQHRTLDEAGMAVVNELATRVGADRVSLGVQRKDRLTLRAISRTAWFDPKSQLVETIENAMEEAIDQEASIVVPALPGARSRVSVAHRDLATRAGAASVLGVPMASGGRIVGALLLERTDGPPFDAQTVLLCEMVGEVLGPGLERLLEREQWLAGRWIDTLAGWRDKIAGPRRPTLKLGLAAAALVALVLAFADGDFRVSARTVIEGAVQRAAVAPFEGYLAEAHVRAGDRVAAGQLLARLDDRDLVVERARWASEREQAEGKYREALAKRDRVASRVLAAQVAQAEAQLALIEEKLRRTRVVAPFDGIVVSGDLSQQLGAPLEQGKLLFELAPLDSYRLILKVDERDIGYVAPSQRGELALTGLTQATLPLTVKTVTSVSTAQEGRNFFRVEAALDEASAPLRPGMEGIAKISAGERRLVWIWTRNFTDWARIAFWSWTP